MTTTCERKNRYPTQGLATKAAQRQSLSSGDIILAYACTSCGGWHIGHPHLGPPPGLRRGKRRR